MKKTYVRDFARVSLAKALANKSKDLHRKISDNILRIPKHKEYGMQNTLYELKTRYSSFKRQSEAHKGSSKQIPFTFAYTLLYPVILINPFVTSGAQQSVYEFNVFSHILCVGALLKGIFHFSFKFIIRTILRENSVKLSMEIYESKLFSFPAR